MLLGFGKELLGFVFRYFGCLYVEVGCGGFFFNIDNVYLLQFDDVVLIERVVVVKGDQ